VSNLLVQVPVPTSIAPREAQRDSVVRTALQALAARRRESELARGTTRRTTAYVYKRAWVDFALFMRYRTGEVATLEEWARTDNVFRAAETQPLLDFLDRIITEIDAADVQAYVEAMLARPMRDRRGKAKVGLENSTINLRLAALKHLLRIAVRMGVRTDNPAHPEMVDRRRTQRTYKQRALSSAQVRALLEALPVDGPFTAHRDHVLLLLLARLGIRREEAAELRADSFSVAPDGGWQVELRRKGDKVQTLLIPDDLQPPVRGYVERWNLGAYLFPSAHGGLTGDAQPVLTSPLHPDEVTRIVRKRTEEILGQARAPHALRSTFITVALDRGVPLADVQAFAGHEDPSTTVRYRDSELKRERSAAQFVSYDEEERSE